MKLITTKLPRRWRSPRKSIASSIACLERRSFNMPMTPVESVWVPALDYSETEKAYVCRLEVPGIPKENLDLNLIGQVLTVSGHREIKREHETEAFYVQERQVGRFVRSIRLPGPVAEAEDRGDRERWRDDDHAAQARGDSEEPDHDQVRS